MFSLPLPNSPPTCRHAPEPWSTDVRNANARGGTGDSGVVLPLASFSSPPPIPPKHTGDRYEKLPAKTRDPGYQYSQVRELQGKEPRYISVIPTPQSFGNKTLPPPVPSSQQSVGDKRKYENIP